MRESGLDAHAAVREAVASRLRPIAMSALTTIFGLAPLVFVPRGRHGAVPGRGRDRAVRARGRGDRDADLPPGAPRWRCSAGAERRAGEQPPASA
ncbi:MAG: hypothetical protein U5K43_12090 [Halofilum sp. (in: g-proteobacteria)]|nr:hypothetical protein [Halofilum sp. (in: g-proteobacteria)]